MLLIKKINNIQKCGVPTKCHTYVRQLFLTLVNWDPQKCYKRNFKMAGVCISTSNILPIKNTGKM